MSMRDSAICGTCCWDDGLCLTRPISTIFSSNSTSSQIITNCSCCAVPKSTTCFVFTRHRESRRPLVRQVGRSAYAGQLDRGSLDMPRVEFLRAILVASCLHTPIYLKPEFTFGQKAAQAKACSLLPHNLEPSVENQ